ncbi:MAG: hypothetical protein QOI34_1839 [Verrucomicrobiota bacterium]
MEAVRLNAGMPIYETGHATHMYGPLLTVMLAGIFRVVGINLLGARVLFSFFGLALAAFLSTILCPKGSRAWWFLAFLLFLGISFRTNLIFFTAQPDCAAALFGMLGLYLWIGRDKSRVRPVISVGLFLCAAFMKQTAAAFALIPIIHTLGWERPLRWRSLVVSVIPASVVAIILIVIYFFAPQLFSGLVLVPATIKVYYGRIPRVVLYLLATFPIFVTALLAAFRSSGPVSERERWVWSAIIVLIPVSIWTTCKSGGSDNSLLYAYLAMTALLVLKLDTILHWIGALPPRRGFAAASAVALVILVSFFVQVRKDRSLLFARCGDEKYDATVVLARQHAGEKVISPQDPTLAYRASGYIGRSLFFELDAHAVNGNWPADLPLSMEEELAQADYVIEVKNYVPTPVFERGLRNQHFRPVVVEALIDSAYTIWQRAQN